jgi:hypothetical protein
MSRYGRPKKAFFDSFCRELFCLAVDVTQQFNMQIESIMSWSSRKKIEHGAESFAATWEFFAATPPLMSDCRQGRGALKQRIGEFRAFFSPAEENSAKIKQFFYGRQRARRMFLIISFSTRIKTPQTESKRIKTQL